MRPNTTDMIRRIGDYACDLEAMLISELEAERSTIDLLRKEVAEILEDKHYLQREAVLAARRGELVRVKQFLRERGHEELVALLDTAYEVKV